MSNTDVKKIMADLDAQIASAEQALDEAMTPERIRTQTDPGDGYENYLTEAEAIVRTPFVAIRRRKVEQLKAIKASLEKENELQDRTIH